MKASVPPRPEPVSESSRLWRNLRAAFVAFHVLGALVMACPSPAGALKKSAWKDPTTQQEFDVWSDRIQSFGVEVSDEELEEFMWQASKEVLAIRRVALKPFHPYAKTTGARQGWRMFVAPHRFPARLHIDIEEQGKWRPVYIARSTEHRWLAEKLDHHRLRKVAFLYSWKHKKQRFRELARWVRARASQDFPEASRVRVRYEKYRTLSPEEVRGGAKVNGKYLPGQILRLKKP